MRFLTLGEVLALHRRILAESGGTPGMRDLGAIVSAVSQPKASVGGQDYPSDREGRCAGLLAGPKSRVH